MFIKEISVDDVFFMIMSCPKLYEEASRNYVWSIMDPLFALILPLGFLLAPVVVVCYVVFPQERSSFVLPNRWKKIIEPFALVSFITKERNSVANYENFTWIPVVLINSGSTIYISNYKINKKKNIFVQSIKPFIGGLVYHYVPSLIKSVRIPQQFPTHARDEIAIIIIIK